MAQSSTEIVKRASQFELMRIEDATGRFVGRVFDVRCRWTRGSKAAPILDALVIGPRGFFEVIGIRRGRSRIVEWSSVESIRDRVITLKESRK